MAHRNFKKEDFKKDETGAYILEFLKGNIGQGSDLIIERKQENDEYETVQAEIHRHEDSIFISWSEPFDGRLIFDE